MKTTYIATAILVVSIAVLLFVVRPSDTREGLAQTSTIFQNVVRTITEYLTREVAVQCPECPRAANRCAVSLAQDSLQTLFTLSYQCQGEFAPCYLRSQTSVASVEDTADEALFGRRVEGSGSWALDLGFAPAITYKLYDSRGAECSYAVAHAPSQSTGPPPFALQYSWVQIDDSAWISGAQDSVATMASYGTTSRLFLGIEDATGEVWVQDETDDSAWIEVGDANQVWTASEDEPYLAVANGKLFAGFETGDVWQFNGTSWTQIGGDGLNSSWPSATSRPIRSIVAHDDKLYVGFGNGTLGEGQVWEYNDATSSWWGIVGGDGRFASWATGSTNEAEAMVSHDGKLYVGVEEATEGAVWEYNSSTSTPWWQQVGGGGNNDSWTASWDQVWSLESFNGNLYAGLADPSGEVWEYDGSTWTRIAGQGENSSWAQAIGSAVHDLEVFEGKLYATLFDNSPLIFEVWEYSAGAWVRVGGQGEADSWSALGSIGSARNKDMLAHGGALYVTFSDINDDGVEVWRYSPGGYSVASDSLAFTQSGFRIFQNQDNIDPLVPVAAENTKATVDSTVDEIRIRLLIHVSGGTLEPFGRSFKLQHARKSTTCAAITSWSDLGLVIPTFYHQNFSVTNGDAISATSTDPTHSSHTIVYQEYVQDDDPDFYFTNSQAEIQAGQDGIWDFAVVNQDLDQDVCFRAVKANGDALDTYSFYPEVRIE